MSSNIQNLYVIAKLILAIEKFTIHLQQSPYFKVDCFESSAETFVLHDNILQLYTKFSSQARTDVQTIGSYSVWINTSFVDIQLNEMIRTISGTIRSAPFQWLNNLSNVPPPRKRGRREKEMR